MIIFSHNKNSSYRYVYILKRIGIFVSSDLDSLTVGDVSVIETPEYKSQHKKSKRILIYKLKPVQ